MTIGVMWEFFEYSVDRVFKLDMQKDEIVYNISSVSLDENKTNKPVKVNDIIETNIIKENGDVVTVNGYLDIGLHDTIEDLFVNFIGARESEKLCWTRRWRLRMIGITTAFTQ